MDSSYRFTPFAFEDLETIWAYIARDNSEAAVRVATAILDACEKLVLNPQMGRKYYISKKRLVRIWVVSQFPNYLLVYRPETEPVQILGVVHGMRNLARILRRRVGK